MSLRKSASCCLLTVILAQFKISHFRKLSIVGLHGKRVVRELELFVDCVILRTSDKMFNVARFESRNRPQNFFSFNSSNGCTLSNTTRWLRI